MNNFEVFYAFLSEINVLFIESIVFFVSYTYSLNENKEKIKDGIKQTFLNYYKLEQNNFHFYFYKLTK